MRLHVESSTASRAPQASDSVGRAPARSSLVRYATRSRISSDAPRWLMPTTVSAIPPPFPSKRPGLDADTEVVADERAGRARPPVAPAVVEHRSRAALPILYRASHIGRRGAAERVSNPRRGAWHAAGAHGDDDVARAMHRRRDAIPLAQAHSATFTSRPRVRASAATRS